MYAFRFDVMFTQGTVAPYFWAEVLRTINDPEGQRGMNATK